MATGFALRASSSGRKPRPCNGVRPSVAKVSAEMLSVLIRSASPCPVSVAEPLDKVITWFEGLNERGKIKGAQPLSVQGRTISGTNGRFVVDGPFTETKEAVGGYLVLQADSFEDAVEVARTNPALRYGVSVEVRPILAECPIFARHPELVRRAKEGATRAEPALAERAA